MAAELYIDGGRFEDTAGFYRQVTAQLARPGFAGGDNLDALCDLLRGGFGALYAINIQRHTTRAAGVLLLRLCRADTAHSPRICRPVECFLRLCMTMQLCFFERGSLFEYRYRSVRADTA